MPHCWKSHALAQFCFVAMIKQFVSDVVWKDMDYLVIDTPPGTSDEHITVVESLKRYNPDGAILVTTPQVMPSCLLTWLKACKLPR